jgi:hypothetical protein
MPEDAQEPAPAAAPPPTPEEAAEARDAIQRMASVTQQTRGLRVRTEGLTLVIWAICMAASYLTFAGRLGLGDRDVRAPAENFTGNFTGLGHPPATVIFVSQFAPLLWFVVALVVTMGVWRSASLSFQTGMSTPRLVATLVGWLLLFVATSVVLSLGVGGPPGSWHLVAWAVVMGLFAILNPLRFSGQGRVMVGIAAVVAFLAAADAYLEHFGPRDASFLSGLAVGLPGLLLGLYLMFTG